MEFCGAMALSFSKSLQLDVSNPQLAAELNRTTGSVPEPMRLRLVDLGEERAAIVIENADSALPVRFEVPINWALE